MTTGRSIAGLVMMGLVLTALTGCTGGSGQSASSVQGTSDTGTSAAGTGLTSSNGASGSSGATHSPTAAPVPYTAYALPSAASLGSVRAQPTMANQPVTLDVLAVVARADSTLVQFRLSTATPMGDINPAMLHPNYGRPDIGGIRLLAKQANLRLDVTYADPGICFCSWMPHDLGPDGVVLTALYPPLPAAVTQVEVAAPNFPRLTVPVKRAALG